MVTPHILGWPSTESWAPLPIFLATTALTSVWPEIDDGAVVTPQMISSVG